jgi:transcriptional regulator with XRE-family HTH domain
MQYIWDLKDYREILRTWIQSQPNAGYGEASRIAEHLKTSRTVISQVLKGERDLTIEQGFELSKFLQLNSSLTDYFICLLSASRAGTKILTDYYLTQAEKIRNKSQQISSRTDGKQVDKEVREKFYSDYAYSAVRLTSELPEIKTANDISTKLGISTERILDIVEFLLHNKLIEYKDDCLHLGPASTHIKKGEPAVLNHHRNWRFEGMKRMANFSSKDLFYTAPTAISLEVSNWLEESLLSLVEELSTKATDCQNVSELRCFNFDLFSFSQS